MQREIVFPNGAKIVIPHIGAAVDMPTDNLVAIPPAPPGAASRAWTYTKAVAKWKAAGSPQRTAEEIESVFAICQACPHFNNEKRPICMLCGCALSKIPNGLKNKIAMATENCPDTPARW